MKKKIKIFSLILISVILISNLNTIGIKLSIRMNCWRYRENGFELGNIYVDNEERSIRIIFKVDSFGEEEINTVQLICDEMYKLIFDKEEYFDYSLDLSIINPSKYTYLSIKNITNDNLNITINGDIEVGDVVKICPEAANVCVHDMEYDSIEIFKEFKQLKMFYCAYEEISEEEKTYILNIFPECEFNWFGKEGNLKPAD